MLHLTTVLRLKNRQWKDMSLGKQYISQLVCNVKEEHKKTEAQIRNEATQIFILSRGLETDHEGRAQNRVGLRPLRTIS